jgi:hypothetical protein
MGKHNHSHKKMTKRCQVDKCTKLGKDIVSGKILCRVHSPCREAFKTKLEKEKKENK